MTEDERVIWKYELPKIGEFSLDLPANPFYLDVQAQRGTPVLWVLVNPNSPKQAYHFVLIPTGQEFCSFKGGMRHLGTVQMYNEELVWHLFELT